MAWKSWEPLFYSEIEKFPSAVLEYRHPKTPNLGDMTKFKQWKDYDADVLVGGTPCQSFSVAGLRKGLDDPRGNLMLTYLAIADRYRPRWMVWENVPGVLSSNGGRDFGTFIGALEQLGYGYCWRVLDAQYFGVPQRRRRVFVVGCLGGWQGAAAVLFESYCLQGHSPPSREEGEIGAATVTSRVASGTSDLIDNAIICHGTQDPCISDKAFALGRNNGGENVLAYCIPSNVVGRKPENGPQFGANYQKNISYTMDAMSQSHVVAFTQNTRDEVREMEVAGALAAQPGAKQQSYVRNNMQVRRLTPVECERLQGFPDNYTQIPWGGKRKELCPDGHRYKAVGNSMAVPVMRWIGKRLLDVDKIREKETQ